MTKAKGKAKPEAAESKEAVTLEQHIASMERAKVDGAALDLARCALWALQNLHVGGVGRRSGAVMDFETGKISRWQDMFFDALDRIDYKIDRAAFFAPPTKGRRR